MSASRLCSTRFMRASDESTNPLTVCMRFSVNAMDLDDGNQAALDSLKPPLGSHDSTVHRAAFSNTYDVH
jgi:hypothetical protein